MGQQDISTFKYTRALLSMNKLNKMISKLDPGFTPQKREYLLKIIDGVEINKRYVFFLDQFVESMDIYKWLADNQITGKYFTDMFEQQFRGCWFSMGKEVLKRAYGINTKHQKGDLKIGKLDLKG